MGCAGAVHGLCWGSSWVVPSSCSRLRAPGGFLHPCQHPGKPPATSGCRRRVFTPMGDTRATLQGWDPLAPTGCSPDDAESHWDACGCSRALPGRPSPRPAGFGGTQPRSPPGRAAAAQGARVLLVPTTPGATASCKCLQTPPSHWDGFRDISGKSRWEGPCPPSSCRGMVSSSLPNPSDPLSWGRGWSRARLCSSFTLGLQYVVQK